MRIGYVEIRWDWSPHSWHFDVDPDSWGYTWIHIGPLEIRWVVSYMRDFSDELEREERR